MYAASVKTTVPIASFSSTARKRILECYRNGVLTDGDGTMFFRKVMNPFGLSYVWVSTRMCRVPDNQNGTAPKRRPSYLELINCSTEQKRKIYNMCITDQIAWKMRTGNELSYYGANNLQPSNTSFCLSGLMTATVLKKKLREILMTPERQKLGDELAAEFESAQQLYIISKPKG